MKKNRLPRPVLWLAGLSICAICVIVILFSVLRLRAPAAFPTLVPEDYDAALIFDDYGNVVSLQDDEAVELVRLLSSHNSEPSESYHLLYPTKTIALYAGGELMHTIYFDTAAGRIANYPYFRQLRRNVRLFNRKLPEFSGPAVPTAELIRSAELTRDGETLDLSREQIAAVPDLWAQLARDALHDRGVNYDFSMEPGACLKLNWGDHLTVELRQRKLPYNTFVHIRYFGPDRSTQVRYRLPPEYDLFADLTP